MNYRSLATIVVVVVAFVCCGAATTKTNADSAVAVPDLSGTISVSGDPVQPAGEPLLFEVTITNTGTKPLLYGRSGPGRYSGLTVNVVDAGGRALHPSLDDFSTPDSGKTTGPVPWPAIEDGWNLIPFGAWQELKPRAAMSFQIALQGVSEGVYDITFTCQAVTPILPRTAGFQWPKMATDAPVRVTVSADPKLLDERDAKLLDRILSGDDFASFAATFYNDRRIVGRLFVALQSDDKITAERAARELENYRTLGSGYGSAVLAVTRKQLAAAVMDEDLLGDLARLAEYVGGADALVAERAILFSDAPDGVRAEATEGYSAFRDGSEDQDLIALLSDSVALVRAAAAGALAERDNPVCIPILLDLVAHPLNVRNWWNHPADDLARFPDDPRVLPALQGAMGSTSLNIRFEARRALDLLARRSASRNH